MPMPLLVVTVIILLAGLVGGLAASTVPAQPLEPETEPPEKPPLRNYLLLGVVASACVPLFLSLLKSQLMSSIFTLPADYESYLIFIGLCLIAAFYARRFIDSVSAQVLQRLTEVDAKASRADAKANQAETTAKEAKDDARVAVEEIEGADNVAGAAPSPDAARAASLDESDDEGAVSITPAERKILEAMAKRTYRTRTGIAEDSGISRNRISEMLEALADRKLALPTTSPRTGGARWIITKRGRAAIGESS